VSHAGVYLHIPFCRSRCSYCDFATGQYDGPLAARYVEAVAKEIAAFQLPEIAPVDTVYFGGGTPSLLTPAQVEKILDAVRRRFAVAPDAEITMEMNPGGLSVETLQAYRALGVNRASFGAQTFDDAELKRLGRRHTAQDVRDTIAHLRAAGFANVSFDLIAGLPAQTVPAWERNLAEALKLQPEHLSLYLLEIHPNTPLADQIRRGAQPRPDDDLAAEMYELLLDKTAAGYGHYEISNFARPGCESRHNSKYWLRAPVYGFGCAAHSHDGDARRWANERDAKRYVELIENTGDAIIERTALSDAETQAEALFLGLRLMRGVDVRAHAARYGVNLRAAYAADLARLQEAGLIEFEDNLLRLTRRGVLLSNEVFAAFV
jgi:oxygen-independent coproporphyrinogen-3 oxidase